MIKRICNFPKSIYHICIQAEFPENACISLEENFKKIVVFSPAYSLLCDCYQKYSIEKQLDFYNNQIEFEQLCKKVDVHPFSSQMIFYLFMLPALKQFYNEEGFEAEMFSLVLKGIRCKLEECHTVYGIYGSFVAIWFSRFFNFTLFPIGRLEFAPISCPVDIDVLGIHKHDPLIDVHIPSRGPLDMSIVKESYKQAIDFFNKRYKKEHLGFFCESWLIYPKNRELIPECKNIMAFMDDYHIYKEEPDNGDLWRIFGSSALTYPQGPLNANTYMQKEYKKHLESGGTMGIGFGIYLI